jgi:NAD(P)-dependent dehydrogenase (short-subunit alcohol dehydrogenase family)
MGRLTDKNILITGGNSGIGLATAQEFDREGARVAICGLNERTLQAERGRWEPEVSPFARTSANSPTSI